MSRILRPIMHYALSRSETPTESLQRIARDQLGRAVSELEPSSDETLDARVHAVRKRLKKLRALLQLVRGSLDPATFKLEDRCFRDAGRQLASSRRAAASLAALDGLRERFASELGGPALESVAQLLRGERQRALGALSDAEQTRRVAELLLEAHARAEHWLLIADGWEAYRRGFRKVYARARKSLGRAEREPNTEALHEWRRWAKYHFYHVRLLGPIWPEALGFFEKALEELTEALGSEHDLDDVRSLLFSEPASSELSETIAPVLHAIERRRHELRLQAFALGNRVFAERPKAAAFRNGAYYASWQAGAVAAIEAGEISAQTRTD